ncbi:hypothetical protein ACFRH6_29680 [Streptomyces sp. NPDC056749]|uniref:hypothetical protein n=1 Tax=Streptomyces sp. NPDC056749 TaxID=3345936 RepID=UPI0036BA91E7
MTALSGFVLRKRHGWTYAVTEVSTPTGKDTSSYNETGDLTRTPGAPSSTPVTTRPS